MTVELTREEQDAETFLLATRFWVQRVLVPILVFVGVAGNAVTATILTRRRMRCTTHIYLTALALADLFYLLFVLLLSFEHYPNIHNSRYELYWRFYGILHWICDAASSTSVWLIVCFTMERYVIVCHPLKGKVYCTERRAKNLITIVSLLCLITTATTSFEYQLTFRKQCLLYCNGSISESSQKTIPIAQSRTCNASAIVNDCGEDCLMNDQSSNCLDGGCHDSKNETCCKELFKIYTEPTDLRLNDTYNTIFNWFSSITFGILPFILIATFNSFLVVTVYKSTKLRKTMTSKSERSKKRNENRITILLIGIVILFLVCQTPTAIFLIYDAFDTNEDLKSSFIKRGLGNIFNLLLTLNASLNFLMYCVLSANYRQTFKNVFCNGKKLNRSDTSAFSVSRFSTRLTNVGHLRRNQSQHCPRTPRNLETCSLNSIPRSKSLMMRALGKAKSSDLHV